MENNEIKSEVNKDTVKFVCTNCEIYGEVTDNVELFHHDLSGLNYCENCYIVNSKIPIKRYSKSFILESLYRSVLVKHTNLLEDNCMSVINSKIEYRYLDHTFYEQRMTTILQIPIPDNNLIHYKEYDKIYHTRPERFQQLKQSYKEKYITDIITEQLEKYEKK